ncbi:MAG: hypothetical protein ABJA71_04590 [Ginsengibacter sp.]
MEQLKFVLPATLLFFSFTVFAQAEKPAVPPVPLEQLVPSPPPPPAPPLPPPPHLKLIKMHNAKPSQKFKKAEAAKQPVNTLPPPPALHKDE